MRKVVVFVEGQAEQIFVREFLLRWYEFDTTKVGIKCIQLISELSVHAPYDFGDEQSDDYYQIINVGGDNKTLSAMLKRAEKMVGAGFQLIIGLRDMYSGLYRDLSPNIVSSATNNEFIRNAEAQIARSPFSSQMKIHFAIMEVEAWILALLDKWIDPIVSVEQLANVFDVNWNLETDIYHPAAVVTEISKLNGGTPYDKHRGQVNSIFSNIDKANYEALYQSNRVPSYNAFIDSLLKR